MSKTPPYEGGAWFRVDFEAVAAKTEPLQQPGGFAIDDRSSVTRILLDEGEVIAYYTLSSGQAEIRDADKRDVLKFLGGSEIGSSHIKWMARAAQAPDGAAAAAILHAGSVASDLAVQEGKGLLTLDPYDAATEAMWRTGL